MRIAMASRYFAPYAAQAPRSPGVARGDEPGTRAAHFAAALAGLGHEIHAISPLPPGLDTERMGLARRLRPLTTVADGEERSWLRFDGSTATGVRAHLLDPVAGPGEPPEEEGWDLDRWFFQAVLALVESLGPGPTWCCSWNPATAPLAVVGAAGDPGAEKPRHLMVLAEAGEWSAAMAAAVEANERVVILGDTLADRWRALNPVFDRLAGENRLAVFPAPVPRSAPPSAAGKADAKAALQVRHGLPVRTDLPLIAFVDASGTAGGELLSRILRFDVQVAVMAGGSPALADRYPDRLRVDAGLSPDALFTAADIAVILGDPAAAPRAMSRGAVPVVAADEAEGVVDLAPDLSSGSGAVADSPSADALWEACGRALAAFRRGAGFSDLAMRIRGFPPTWPRVAADLLGLITGDVTDPGDSSRDRPATTS